MQLQLLLFLYIIFMFKFVRTVSHDSIALIDHTLRGLEGWDLSSGVFGCISIGNLEVDSAVFGDDLSLVKVSVLVSVDLHSIT